MILIDLDDFCEDNQQFNLLWELKQEIPAIRLTLFTIVGRCSVEWLTAVQKYYNSWIDLVPHGLLHSTSRECERWTLEESRQYLEQASKLGLTRGFKAPGWQISDGMYQALGEKGYWVADQTYNNHRRPVGLKYYLLDSPTKIHGHIGHLGGHNPNELSLILPQILELKRQEFGFVRDHVV